MAQLYPETEETEDAAVGTASHEVGAALIQAATVAGVGSLQVGSTASNGVIITEEMFEGAKLYADDVTRVMRSTGVFAAPNLGIEQRLAIIRVHELSAGTPDCFLFDTKTMTLYIWDYKFGYGVVEAFENWQGTNYLPGIMAALGLDRMDGQDIKVEFRIIQPRAHHRDGPIRPWKTTAAALRGHINQLETAAAEALGPNPTYRSNPGCKHCTGRHACEAALRGGVNLFEAATTAVPVELTPLALGVQLILIRRALKQLEYLESGYAARVESTVRSGTLVPGWGVEPAYGNEKWKVPAAEVIAMGSMLNQDLRKEGAKTPNQARKLGIDAAVITAYSEKPRAGVKIVPDNGSRAKQVFTS